MHVMFYRGAQSAMGGSYYGTGSYRQNDILMDEVECKGTEHRVQECTHVPVHDCTLNEAASVSCMLNDGRLCCVTNFVEYAKGAKFFTWGHLNVQ